MASDGSDLSPLGGEASSILKAGRAAEQMPEGRKSRITGRVMAAVGASAAAAAAGAGAAEAAAGLGAGVAKGLGLSLFAKIGIGVGLVTLGIGGAVLSAAYSGPAGTPTQATEAPKPTETSILGAPASAAPTSEAPAKSATEETPPLAPSAPASASGGPKPAVSASGSAAVDSLDEETRLLTAAHAELSRGNAEAALQLLDTHAARFPKGILAPERRAARAMALCKLGRTEEGRKENDSLYGKDAKNPLAQKIDRACRK